ncbi:MAG: lytic transglycosylase domain-containing protein [Victivallaceae bacterium]|nr:lytic transglycosylase domain-containing protein [Victivallaceae bacterium]
MLQLILVLAALGGAGNIALNTRLGHQVIHRIWPWSAEKCEPFIKKAAAQYGVDPDLIRAVIWTESHFDPDKVGGAGEIGLMQILPSGAAAEYARLNHRQALSADELFDPATNIEVGTWFLKQGLDRYADRKDGLILAICFYNAGDSRARRWAEAPDGEVMARIDIPSTRDYVEKVLKRFHELKGSD